VRAVLDKYFTNGRADGGLGHDLGSPGRDRPRANGLCRSAPYGQLATIFSHDALRDELPSLPSDLDRRGRRDNLERGTGVH
jgi:hypothetical protein